jgi:type I restriction enzyme S subunit
LNASGIVEYVDGFVFDEDLLCVSEDGANLVARTYPIAFPISGKTWVNNHAHVLRFDNACTQKFVEVYLNSIKLDEFLTGMAQPKLNKAMLDKIPIPYSEVLNNNASHRASPA